MSKITVKWKMTNGHSSWGQVVDAGHFWKPFFCAK